MHHPGHGILRHPRARRGGERRHPIPRDRDRMLSLRAETPTVDQLIDVWHGLRAGAERARSDRGRPLTPTHPAPANSLPLMEYDLVVRNGRVVDPANAATSRRRWGHGRQGERGRRGSGRRACTPRDRRNRQARDAWDLDPHVHLARNGAGNRMMAKVGVAPRLDASGRSNPLWKRRARGAPAERRLLRSVCIAARRTIVERA